MSEDIELKQEGDDELEQVSGGNTPFRTAACKFCGKTFPADKLVFHIEVCSSNPNHKTLQDLVEEYILNDQ